MTKVSIITTTYNHGKYIEQCINSVLVQSYQDWEMIIVDDGSTDDTVTIIDRYTERDKRIKLICQQNAGINALGKTYNTALSRCEGKFICILEGDDFWEPDKLTLQVAIMDDSPDLVLSYGVANAFVSETGKVMKLVPLYIKEKQNEYNNNPLGSYFNVMFDDFFAPLTYMIRKSRLLEIGGFIQTPPFPSVDLSTFLALCKLGPFDFQNKVLGSWRVSATQTTKTLPIEIFEGSHKIMTQHFSTLTPTQLQNVKITKAKIDNEYRKRYVVVHARNGRFQLIKKQYAQARKSYIKSILSYGFTEWKWKIRSLIGIVFSYLHLDVEWLAEKLGKGRIS
jgi:glycosyltransferase involved in cell wall biosynthesis